MSQKETTYYPTFQTVRNQKSMLFMIMVMFVVTELYASSLKHPTARHFIAYLGLVYPIVVLMVLSTVVPWLNFTRLDKKGIHLTNWGFIRKTILWIDIEAIKPTYIGGVDGMGILLKPSSTNTSWRDAIAKNKTGYDKIVMNYYRKDGVSLLDDGIKGLKSFNRTSKK